MYLSFSKIYTKIVLVLHKMMSATSGCPLWRMCVKDAAFEAVNKLLFFNLINLCSVLIQGAPVRNRLARRTYKQYHAFLRDAEVTCLTGWSLFHISFISVRYKEMHLRGSFCTQITSKFAHYQRHSTLESVTNIHSNSPKFQDIQKSHSFLHCA